MAALTALRAATAEDHASVDAAFGGFALGDRIAYGRFLTAHARALPPIEAALAGVSGLPPLRPRTPMLAADLAALGLAMPAAMPQPVVRGPAEAFGMAYVIEGSRLGGGLLARSVPADFPCTYLSATFLPGEWRALGAALDAAAGDDPAWIAQAAAAAKGMFARYAEAALA